MNSRLGDIAEIHSGYLLKSEAKVGIRCHVTVVQPKDISSEGRVIWPSIETPLPSTPQPVHFIDKGDVLFLSKMNPRPVLIDSNPERPDTIVSSHFFIIRPKTGDIRPDFLFWFLNQPDTRKFIRSVAAGSSILNVKKSDLQEIMVPIPPPEVQKRITELAELVSRYRDLHEQIIHKTERLIEHCTRKALDQFIQETA